MLPLRLGIKWPFTIEKPLEEYLVYASLKICRVSNITIAISQSSSMPKNTVSLVMRYTSRCANMEYLDVDISIH